MRCFSVKNVAFPLGENFCQKARTEKQNLNSTSEYTHLLLKVILQVFLPLLCFSPCSSTHFHHGVSYRKTAVASFVQALFSFGNHAAFWKKKIKFWNDTEWQSSGGGEKNCCFISIYIYMCLYLYFLCSFIESGLLTCFLFVMGNIVLLM